eukprot:6172128-Pleurochrysis_carterae.AAC.8
MLTITVEMAGVVQSRGLLLPVRRDDDQHCAVLRNIQGTLLRAEDESALEESHDEIARDDVKAPVLELAAALPCVLLQQCLLLAALGRLDVAEVLVQLLDKASGAGMILKVQPATACFVLFSTFRRTSLPITSYRSRWRQIGLPSMACRGAQPSGGWCAARTSAKADSTPRSAKSTVDKL